MDISIIIPVYKRTEWVKKCIEKLMQQSYGCPFEIIIVDDGSPNKEEIRGLVEQSGDTRPAILEYLKCNHGGPAAARNYGVRHSSGNILCFLDDDSLPDKDWIREIMRSFQESTAVALVSGRTLSLHREKSLPRLLEEFVYPKKSWATCNIAYRRDVFESLEGFDESFKFPSWEDNDLGFRAKWAGCVHVYNMKAIVYHLHEQTLMEYKKKCLLNGRGAAVFSRKYFLKKPFLSIGTPLVMSRGLLYFMIPSVWMRRVESAPYLKFMWSLYSLQGFLKEVVGNKHGKD